MTKFKVACSPLTSTIFAGKIVKDGMWGSVKHDVTDDAVTAVAQHLLQKNVRSVFTYKGKQYEMKVTEIEK